jgi:hypothetical protein
MLGFIVSSALFPNISLQDQQENKPKCVYTTAKVLYKIATGGFLKEKTAVNVRYVLFLQYFDIILKKKYT